MIKTIFTYLLIAAILCLPLEARRRWIPKASAIVPTLKQTVGNDGSGSNIGVTNYQYYAGSFTASSSYALDYVIGRIQRNGGGTASDITMTLRADSGGTPGSVIASSSTTYTSAMITAGSANDYNFTFAAVALTNGTVYWLTYTTSGVDATNNYTVRISDGSTGGAIYNSADGSSWGVDWSGRQLYLRNYGH